MVVDNAYHTVFLFGGDMADFWTYHVPSGKWSLLSPDNEAEGGPPNWEETVGARMEEGGQRTSVNRSGYWHLRSIAYCLHCLLSVI